MWRLLASHPAFRRLWLAATVDAFGNWLLVTAVPVQVFARTGSPASTALALAVGAGPALLLGPWAGAVVDRLPRSRVLVRAGLVAAAGVLVMLAPGAGFLYLGVAVEGVAVCFLAPAVQASVPLVAPDLAAATSALAVSQNAWRVLGPSIGAAATAAGWFPAVVVTDALSYLVAAALLSATPTPATTHTGAPGRGRPCRCTASHHRAGTEATGTDAGAEAGAGGPRAGLRFVARRPVLRAVTAGSCLYWTANAALTALLVPFVVDRLHAGSAAVGYLVTGLGVGYLAGSALTRRLLVRGPAVIAAGYGLVGVCFLVLVTAPSLPIAVAAVTASGLPGAAALAATTYCVQTEAPDTMRGRVAAALRTSDAFAAIAGALAAPLVVAAAGLGAALLVFAATVPAAATLTAVLLPRRPPSRAAPPHAVPDDVVPERGSAAKGSAAKGACDA